MATTDYKSSYVIRGVNDIGTTNPEIIKYLLYKDDAYKYSKGTNKKVWVKCPLCGSTREIAVVKLVEQGYILCYKCSDKISYPNKFAHEFFNQLSSQYVEYIPEFSPSWAGKLRYDNYIQLLDGRKIIIEMDGGLHYKEWNYSNNKNDIIKDNLALNNNIIMIRVNCNYEQMSVRYEYIKNNMIKSLSNYFDLSNVDWDLCNKSGISNMVSIVSAYYQEHSSLTMKSIATHFNISAGTLRNYLSIGTELNLCNYKKVRKSDTNKPKPVIMYDLNGGLIGIFGCVSEIVERFPEKGFIAKSMRTCIKRKKVYKGYIFKYLEDTMLNEK